MTGEIVFQDRFDEDDFGAAYAELERRCSSPVRVHPRGGRSATCREC